MNKSFTTYIIIFFVLLTIPISSKGEELKSTYPRLANYFLKWEISEQEALDLSKWDLLILDMETQNNSPRSLEIIKELNPNVIILGYITSQEIIDDINKTAGFTGAYLRDELRSNIVDSWWLRDSNGNKISNWPGTYMLNLSNQSGQNSRGENFNDYLPRFVSENIASSRFFDGVFYDNTWGDVSWVNSSIDINNDGKADSPSVLDTLWSEGYREMLEKTRDLTDDNFIIVGNGRVFWDYQDLLNGMMLESFPSFWENGGTWSGSMETYLKLPDNNRSPQFNVINVNKKNEQDYQGMRFGLASTLMGEGFYSFDYDVTNHSQAWWYDEYSVNLGPAQSPAYNLLNNKSQNIEPGLWRRDFKFGSVFLNSTDKTQVHIFNKEDFEKINGVQDKDINSGKKINHIKLAANDGLVALKTSDNVFNETFINGYFYRVFDSRGQKVKNGFFSFSSAFPAGAAVIIADGSRREIEEVNMVANNGQVYLNKNGNRLVSFSAYDNLFRGKLNIDTKLNDGFFELAAIGPTAGGGPQVRLFSAEGNLLSSFFAYDKDFRGGVSVALGDVDGDGIIDLVTGSGYGDEPRVKVFSLSGQLKYTFLAYDKNFKGGIEVAAGDLNANGKSEIVTVPGKGGGPQVRIFNHSGKALGQFFAYDPGYRGGLKITVSDIDNDGKSEILAGVKNFF